MRINRRRSSNIMIIAIITMFVGIIAGIVAGCLSGVEIKSDFYFNWSNALIAFVPLLAAGMLLFGLAQLASLETQNLFTAWKNGRATTADVFQSAISDMASMTSKQEALTLATSVWGSLGEDNAMSVITALNNVNDTTFVS